MLEVTEEDLDRLEAALRPYLRPATEPPKANGKANGTHEPPGSRLRAYAPRRSPMSGQARPHWHRRSCRR